MQETNELPALLLDRAQAYTNFFRSYDKPPSRAATVVSITSNMVNR
jgi:hypothetical protein